MGRKPIPMPSFLDDCEYLGFVHGERRWRSRKRKRLYTWDALHGDVEVFNARGRHLGSFDPVTEELMKEPVRGRTIDV
jgi:hypothetical protein